MRNRAIIKKQIDLASRPQTTQICPLRIDAGVIYIMPLLLTQTPYPPCLPRCENRETNAMLGENIERRKIDSRFRQPHSLRRASETMLEVCDPPNDLCLFIPLVG